MLIRSFFLARMTDNGDGTCNVTKVVTGGGGPEQYSRVPTPNIAGTSGSGVFMSHGPSTMVLCATMDDVSSSGEGGVIVLQTIPDQTLYQTNDLAVAADAPLGGHMYPVCDPQDSNTADLALSGSTGSSLEFPTNGDVSLQTNKNMGIRFENGPECGDAHIVSGNIYETTESLTRWSGRARRFIGSGAETYSAPTIGTNRLRHDYNTSKSSGLRDVGLFRSLAPWIFGRDKTHMERNPHLAESVNIYNEFTVSSAYSGADDEPGRYSGAIPPSNANDTRPGDRKPGNVLFLNENRIAGSVKGNLICPNGYQLDVNLNVLKAGDASDRYFSDGRTDTERWTEIGRRTRRGVASFFQIATNSKSTDPTNSQSNFVSCIDKEGALKLTIPKTSNLGNILYASNTEYVSPESTPVTSLKNPSKVEFVPVTLRGANGEVIFPSAISGGDGDLQEGQRYTGMEFYNGGEQNRYFPTDDSRVRVNLTAHHNMCATAERLISNITSKVVSLSTANHGMDLDPLKTNEFIQVMGKPTHWDAASPPECIPTYMNYCFVSPEGPAVHPGGRSIAYCGNKEQDYLRYTNAFTAEDSGDGSVNINIENMDGEKYVSGGGFSANINLEGCLIASLGQTDYQQISCMLDTAGSIIARVGTDKDNRSIILDTDGSFYMDVGGSYTGPHVEGPEAVKGFIPGRFEMRVNIADLGHVKKFNNFEPEEGQEVKAHKKGDFVISISEAGLVISGNGGDSTPMIIRNDGPMDLTCSGVMTIGGAQGTNVIMHNGEPVPIGTSISK